MHGERFPSPDNESFQSRSPLGTEDAERGFSSQWGERELLGGR